MSEYLLLLRYRAAKYTISLRIRHHLTNTISGRYRGELYLLKSQQKLKSSIPLAKIASQGAHWLECLLLRKLPNAYALSFPNSYVGRAAQQINSS